MTFEFFVHGIPRPKGSLRMVPVGGGRVRLTSDNRRLKDWHACVEGEIVAAGLNRVGALEGPVRVHLAFYLPKPKRPKSPKHITKPDIDKIARATLDPMTGLLFGDDAQVMALYVTKEYETADIGPGARVRVESVG